MSLTKQQQRKTKKRRRRRRHDEQQESRFSAGLSGLQQSVGNRAVQRMISQEEAEEQKQAKKKQAVKEQLIYETAREVMGLQEPEEVVDPPDMELLSGEQWVKHFPASDKLVDLESTFGKSVTDFINAMEAAGASVDILSTLWPPERAYMMHFAWLIANELIDPRQVPPVDEVDFGIDVSVDLEIVWWHGNLEDSQAGAQEMVEAFGLAEVETPPPLASRHVSGEAIDMRLSWGNEGLLLTMPDGEEVEVAGAPHDETNLELMALAAAFGVIHYPDPDEDAVHWSVDGA